MTPSDARLCVLVLAGGARWEAEVLDALGTAGVVVAKRCVDVPDLMASVVSSAATVAIVEGTLPHLDAEAVMHLLRYDVRVLAVCSDTLLADRLARIGVVESAAPMPREVLGAVQRAAARDVVADPEVPDHVGPADRSTGRGRVVAVWGPAGAPGRTTVAVGLAAELALTRSTVLVDADPYGGAVAQALGVLDEISGLLAVARMANTGTLDEAAFARSCRRIGPRLHVLTGLPRADRRVEVRPDVLGGVLDVASRLGEVVVDCGFCLEDAEQPSARDRMTIDALRAADEVVVVGSAEPSGLGRLARSLVEARELLGSTPVRVLVNRMRGTLGWSEREIAGMVEGFSRPLGVHFLPEDRASIDRSLVAGRSLTELGGASALRTALADVAGVVWRPAGVPPAGGRRRRRVRAAQDSAWIRAQAPNSR